MTLAPTLSGRAIAITGAGRGLGRALAITAADLGAELVLLGRARSAVQTVADTIKSRTGRDVASLQCDLADSGSISEACRQTLAVTPVVDVLINNGAPWLPGSIEQLSDADIAATIAAAVTGTVLITKGLLPALRRSAAADIVTIVSTAGLPGRNHASASAAFHAAKHGQAGFSERLREELRRDGIRVCAIYPPDFDDTDPLDTLWSAVRNPCSGAKLTNREVIAAIVFAISAPRVCAYPTIVLANMAAD